MTAPKWAMDLAYTVLPASHSWPHGLRSELARALVRVRDSGHREGWQAAIEAPLTQEVVEAGIAAVGADDDRPAIELAIDVFNAMRRSLPYQPPEDRGDG